MHVFSFQRFVMDSSNNTPLVAPFELLLLLSESDGSTIDLQERELDLLSHTSSYVHVR